MHISIEIQKDLEELRTQLIGKLLESSTELSEGTVMTMGPAPYRRIDCNGRAVAYIRTRPRKQAVRVDISGLWVICPQSRKHLDRIMVRSATGSVSLLIKSKADIEASIQLIVNTVLHTQKLERDYTIRKQAREEEGRAA
ncbi:MAG: hypothetical protein VYC39_07945 [Myxococcota bacterium]|nr:hypothetical protein [Myxococcota bacterium]